MTETKDYLIEIRVKNNHLLKKISAAGYVSVSEFARAVGIHQTVMSKYVTLKSPAIDRWGKWRKSVERMAKLLKCLPEDLFPPQHIDKALKTSKATIEAGIEEVAVFLTGGEDTARTALEHITREEATEHIRGSLSTLTPREQQVLEMRYGLDMPEHFTLDQAAKVMGVTKERVRQIEIKALRKLKQQRVPLCLLEAVDEFGLGSRFRNRALMPRRHYVPEWKRGD